MKIHRVYGYLQGICVSFLLNLCLDPAPIYLTTNIHYEGADNLLGGNGKLNQSGDEYASILNSFFDVEKNKWKEKGLDNCDIFYSPGKAFEKTAKSIELDEFVCKKIRCHRIKRIFHGDLDNKT